MHHSSTKRSALSLRRKMNSAFMAIAALALLVTPVQATPPGSDMQLSKQSVSSRQICQGIMRLGPGEALFERCVASLEELAPSAAADRVSGSGPDTCFAALSAEGNTGTNMCEAPDTSVSFYAASFDTKMDRERRACARLGLDLRGVAFTSCVSNLQDSVDTAGEPDSD